MRLKMVLAGAVLALAAWPANAAEFLTNGGFETGDFSGWTLTEDPSTPIPTTVQPSAFGYGAQSGNFYVYAGPSSASPSTLSQTFFDTSGQNLAVSGWAIGDTFDSPNNLGNVAYYFDGTLLGSPDLSSGLWTQSLFNVQATGHDTFSIIFSNDNSFNGLDSFSVSSLTATTPLPSSWTMMLLGLAGFGFAAYRSSRNGSATAHA